MIGEDFSGGQLQTFADQSKVTLITTGLLSQVLRLHGQAPFNLHELKDLFSCIGRADSAVQQLSERHSRNQRYWRLIVKIIDILENFQRNTPNGSAPKIDNLQFHLMLDSSQSPSDAPTVQDVADAVGFLSNRATNILVEVPGSAGAYQLAMSGSMARKRLLSLARFFEKLSVVPSVVAASGQQGQAP